MMKKIKDIMSKPVTWGVCFKATVIMTGLYTAVFGAYEIYLKWMDYKAKKAMEKLDENNSDWKEI